MIINNFGSFKTNQFKIIKNKLLIHQAMVAELFTVYKIRCSNLILEVEGSNPRLYVYMYVCMKLDNI